MKENGASERFRKNPMEQLLNMKAAGDERFRSDSRGSAVRTKLTVRIRMNKVFTKASFKISNKIIHMLPASDRIAMIA